MGAFMDFCDKLNNGTSKTLKNNIFCKNNSQELTVPKEISI